MSELCRHCGQGKRSHIGTANACFGGMGTIYKPEECCCSEPDALQHKHDDYQWYCGHCLKGMGDEYNLARLHNRKPAQTLSET